MSIVDQIRNNLVNPDKHTPILEALVEILEVRGEKGVKDQIKRWVEEVEQETPPIETSVSEPKEKE